MRRERLPQRSQMLQPPDVGYGASGGGEQRVFPSREPEYGPGFPGTFEVTVTYTLTEENELKIHYNGYL